MGRVLGHANAYKVRYVQKTEIFGIWTPIMLYFGVKCALLHPLGPHIE